MARSLWQKLFGKNDVAIDNIDALPANTLVVETRRKSYQISLKPNETLLDAMLRHKVNIAYSCNEGVCGSCQCKLLSGQVTMKENLFLNDKEIADGLILACQATPVTKQVQVKL